MRNPAAQPLALRLRGNASRAQTPARGSIAAFGARAGSPAGPMWPVLLACLAIASVSLLFPSTPTYDPWAWLLWGREILELDLVTEGGPSWKPLPVLFTGPFSLFGEEVAPYLWLVVARAGALLALVMAFRLARRLVGPGVLGVVAGLAAAAFLVTTYQFVRDSMLGNSEALLAALALWSFERHLDGRHDHAFYLAFAAALLRPEVWPFLGAYGLWLWFREPELRLRIAAAGALIPLLWFGPELWGSGEPLRASSRANNPNPGSAAFAEHPGVEVVKRFHDRTILPLEALALLAGVVAAVQWRRRRAQGAVLALCGVAVAWIGLVAFMTERGYAGNQRYLIVATAAICVLGGIGTGMVLGALAGGLARPGARHAVGRRGRWGRRRGWACRADARHRATRPTTWTRRSTCSATRPASGTTCRTRSRRPAAATACWPAATSTAGRSRPSWWPTSWASTASTSGRWVARRRPGWRSAPTPAPRGRWWPS